MHYTWQLSDNQLLGKDLQTCEFSDVPNVAIACIKTSELGTLLDPSKVADGVVGKPQLFQPVSDRIQVVQLLYLRAPDSGGHSSQTQVLEAGRATQGE